MTPPDRLRALLAEPSFVVMPAVWDGLSAKLSGAVGFKTAFQSGSCVAASRLGGPDLAACRGSVSDRAIEVGRVKRHYRLSGHFQNAERDDPTGQKAMAAGVGWKVSAEA